MKYTKLMSTALALGAAFATSTVSTSAEAAIYNCDGGIEYVDAKANEMQLGCWSGGIQRSLFVFVTAPAGCSAYNRSSETLRNFLSHAQASVLSGKKLDIYYESCGGFNHITAISLRRVTAP
jgi:hypothetical protein